MLSSNSIPFLTLILVMVCSIRFLLDGVGFFGYIPFGHVDPMSYGAILAPILGAHSYIHVQTMNHVDNPDKE